MTLTGNINNIPFHIEGNGPFTIKQYMIDNLPFFELVNSDGNNSLIYDDGIPGIMNNVDILNQIVEYLKQQPEQGKIEDGT
jgi:hypothetical protein